MYLYACVYAWSHLVAWVQIPERYIWEQGGVAGVTHLPAVQGHVGGLAEVGILT